MPSPIAYAETAALFAILHGETAEAQRIVDHMLPAERQTFADQLTQPRNMLAQYCQECEAMTPVAQSVTTPALGPDRRGAPHVRARRAPLTAPRTARTIERKYRMSRTATQFLTRPLRWLQARCAPTADTTVVLGDTDALPLPYNDPYFGLLHAMYALQHDIQRSETAADALRAFVGARVLRTAERLVFELAVRVTSERVAAGLSPEDGPVLKDLEIAREHLHRALSAVTDADSHFYDYDDEPAALED
ncbi:hypothetical protein [Streptomyces sp. 8N706]|uniref:hypothetical protein n=1 Tax=Streptomyces sp. 8N706 TaxID=3457416 RepID=UPI003FD348DA